MSGMRAVVLAEDPQLGEQLDRARFSSARYASVAAAERLDRGTWRPDRDGTADGYGVLVLGGLLVRRVTVAGRVAAELLTAGDLLRPRSPDERAATVEADTDWHVLAAARLALLDGGWMQRMAPYPEVGAALGRRALERCHRLLATMSIAAERRLEVRLWTLLWQIAERHGRVHADGVYLDFPLSHELLGHLTGARRPSVSTAVQRLVEADRVRRHGRGWLLMGEPPPSTGA